MDGKKNVNLIIDKAKKHLGLFPFAIGMAYFIGFIVVNSYLSEFDFIHDSLLSINYLSAGFSFMVFTIPLIVIIYSSYKNPTDNASKSKHEFWSILSIIFYYALLLDIFTFNKEVAVPWQERVIYFTLLLYTMIVFFLSSNAARNVSWIKSILWMLIPILIYNIFSIFYLPVIKELKFLIVLTGLAVFLILGDMGDNDYSISRTGLLIFGIIISSALFGYSVYDKIPPKFGGTKRPYVQCFVNKEGLSVIKKLDVKFDSLSSFSCQIRYSSQHYFLVKHENQMFTLNRSDVKSFRKIQSP